MNIGKRLPLSLPRTRSRASSLAFAFCLAAIIGAALAFTAAPASAAVTIPPGVPEPGLVIWGTVVNQTNTAQPVPILSAAWTVSDGTKTAAFSGETRPAVRIVSLSGQSYYVLEVPFDTRRMGTVTLSDPATVGLDSFELKASSPPTYSLTPTINGVLATVRSVNGAPAGGESLPVSGFTSAARGRVIRVDLAILPPADNYDLWAEAIFGDATLPEAARDADPDGDGMTNEEEFEAGTSPVDPESVLRLLTLTLNPADNQATVQWKSVSGKQYRIQAAASVAGPWGDVGNPVSGLEDVTQTSVGLPAGDVQRFFRVRLVP